MILTLWVKLTYHEVSDSEADLVHQQQREVDHLSAFLRAAGTNRETV